MATRLSREQIIRSILEPSAEIAKGNETINVETRDGEIHSGLFADESSTELKLRIGGNALQAIPKTAIRHRETSKTSGMPQGLEQAMSRQEFLDLVEYLATRK